eukprot:403349549
MEYCEGGDLAAIIRNTRKMKDHLAEDVIWKILMQITLGLYQCHRRQQMFMAQNSQNTLTNRECPQKILHRDLKPGNIFLDGNNNVKIGDFGLARVMNQESQFAYTHVGTPYYMSPEQINESKYNEQSDIWSLGCIIYEMAALHPPFTAQNHLSLAVKIKTGKFERIPNRYSDELQRVVSWMLQQNHHERPNVDDLMNLPHISTRIREKSIEEVAQLIKKKEEEFKQREENLKLQEQQLKDKELQLNDKENIINEFIRNSQDLSCSSCGSNEVIMNYELVKSLQKLASTMAGESYLTVSERLSMGNQLKESKMSSNSFGAFGLESSGLSKQSRAKLTKMKSEQEFKTYAEAMKLLQSGRIQNVDTQSEHHQSNGNGNQSHLVSSSKINSSKGNSQMHSKIPSGKKIPNQNELQFFPERESFEQRFNTLPDQFDEDEIDQSYSLQSSRNRNDTVCNQSEFRETVFNPNVKQNSRNYQSFGRENSCNATKKAFKTYDQLSKVVTNKNQEQQLQCEIRKLQSRMNKIPLPTKRRESDNTKPTSQHSSAQQTQILSNNGSVETLLSQKLNESSNRVISRSRSKNLIGQQQNLTTMNNTLLRQDSIDKLARYLPGTLSNLISANQTFDLQKNSTQQQFNFKENLSQFQHNSNNNAKMTTAFDKQDKMILQKGATIKRCASNTKTRPPLTDRTNTIMSQKYSQNQVQKQQLILNQLQNKIAQNQVLSQQMQYRQMQTANQTQVFNSQNFQN